MNARTYATLAALGSLAVLLSAFAFQHIGGMAPCKLCLWQRYPHGLAGFAGLLFWSLQPQPMAKLALGFGALSAAATAMIGFYHAGVEHGIFEGPTSCTAGSIQNLSTDDLMAQIMTAPLVRCDDIPWELFGLSMAGWNGVLSLALCALWLLAYRRFQR